jgi:citrate lyase beta subunit
MDISTKPSLISSFYFINYNRDDIVSSLIPPVYTTICLDLEDSVQDIFYPALNSDLKASSRSSILKLLSNNKIPEVNWAIRLNSFQSNEIDYDISLLEEENIRRKIKTVLLPKAENAGQIEELLLRLRKSEIEIDDIIPIIETKKGFVNLKQIALSNKDKIKRIAFGHCDFNADNNFFPFFHQDASQYWEWVKEITSILTPLGIQFVNSPFLNLNDDDAFNSMLSKLYNICQTDFGQITLTQRQSLLCNKFRFEKNQLNGFSKKMCDEKISSYAGEIKHNFETYNKRKGFSISDKRVLISPHEYFAAGKFIKSKAINLTIAGGCFTEQSNIAKEKLYHNIAKRKFEEDGGKNLSVNIIRYERFTNCYEKIKEGISNNHTDILLFHLRIEHILRIAKLIYKYSDKGKVKRKLTLPFLNKIPSEEKELLQKILGQPNPNVKKPEGFSKFKITLNYLMGRFFGNVNYAFELYDEIFSNLIELCRKKNIKLIICGPASRPYLDVENKLSEKLSLYFKLKSKKENIPFIDLLGYIDDNNESLFFESGIHVSEAGHKRAAELLFGQLKENYSI